MSKQFFYEDIAGDFDELMNAFDVRRRLEVVYDQFLTGDLAGLRLLDVGCGTGRFSERACQRGAEAVALDVGPNLLKRALAGADVAPVVGDGGGRVRWRNHRIGCRRAAFAAAGSRPRADPSDGRLFHRPPGSKAA